MWASSLENFSAIFARVWLFLSCLIRLILILYWSDELLGNTRFMVMFFIVANTIEIEIGWSCHSSA